MKKYKVLKEFINPANLLHFEVGREFYYDNDFYFVIYNYSKRCLEVKATGWDNCGVLVFSSKEDAQASITNHEKEWLIYLGVEE